MKNSEVKDKTRPLKFGEIIQKGDVFWTYENDTIIWLPVGEDYFGKDYDPALYSPMRRPIPQSLEFICQKQQ